MSDPEAQGKSSYQKILRLKNGSLNQGWNIFSLYNLKNFRLTQACLVLDGGVINFTFWKLYPQRKRLQYQLDRRLGWSQNQSGHGKDKNPASAGNHFDHPGLSLSLYCLSSPSSYDVNSGMIPLSCALLCYSCEVTFTLFHLQLPIIYLMNYLTIQHTSVKLLYTVVSVLTISRGYIRIWR
jgi:hypothetical protein